MGQKKVVTIDSSAEQEAKSDAKKSGAFESAKGSRGLSRANIYINASYNNTIISVTDERGNVLAYSSAGALGFSGPKKSTPYASAQVANAVTEKMKKYTVGEVAVYVNGVGQGRESAIRTLGNNGFHITLLKDTTPVPHNGPRAPKPRRV